VEEKQALTEGKVPRVHFEEPGDIFEEEPPRLVVESPDRPIVQSQDPRLSSRIYLRRS
jgi:hypothetical protein